MVDQLTSPDKYGHIQVTRERGGRLWQVKTRNLHRFHLLPSKMRLAVYPTAIRVDDGSETPFSAPAADTVDSAWFVKDEATGTWAISNDGAWQRDIMQRYGRQNGAMDAILRSMGTFTIRICSRDNGGGSGSGSGSEQMMMNVALQISRNLLQYFAADSRILPPQTTECNSSNSIEEEEEMRRPGNLITIAIGNDLPPPSLLLHDTFPIYMDEGQLTVRTTNFHATSSSTRSTTTTKYTLEPDLGAIFLRPLPRQRLELVIWGADVAGLQQASRLVPLLTGVGQPDFVILSARCRWQGFAGVYAAGFFDFGWRVSAASYVG